jgi:hypothetical protein
MKDQTLGAIAVGLLAVGSVGAAWTLHTFASTSNFCPGPSAAVVVPLLAPCQAFATSSAQSVSADSGVRISLPAFAIKPAPVDPPHTQFAEK